MPLSPQDVRDKLFTPVRFRPGYDEDEVDAFLDEVETELAHLHAELVRLRTQLSDAQGADAPEAVRTEIAADTDLVADIRAEADERVRTAVAAAEERAAAQLAALRSELESRSASQPAAAQRDQVETSAADTGEVSDATRRAQEPFDVQLQRAAAEVARAQQQAVEAQQQATQAQAELARLRASSSPSSSDVSEETLRRTLILAQRTADAAVAEARAEASELVSTARVEAGHAASEAAASHAEQVRRQQAELAAAAARARAEQELMMSKLEELRSFERDYRGRLRAYLHLQLRDLEAGAPEPTQALAGRQAAAIGGGPLPGTEAAAATSARTDEHAEPAAAEVPAAVDRDAPSVAAEPTDDAGSGGDGSAESAPPAFAHLPDDTWNEYGQQSEEEEAR